GLSVSRVGGSAQVPAMKSIAGNLRLELALYRELAAFAQFGSDLDAVTQRALSRGARLVEILKQGQYVPMHVGLQVAIMYAATKGYLDKVEIPQVLNFEKGLAAHLTAKYSALLAKIEQRAKLNDIEAELKAGIEEFAKGFKAHA
ncbi:MAG: F0F1 ATP synthase subunit alpha, partial [Pseudomonadota bacterium]